MTSKAHQYPVTDHLCNGDCEDWPDGTKQCESTCHYDLLGQELDLECVYPEGHIEPFHFDEGSGIYYDKYSDNRTDDMYRIDRYIEYRVERAVAETVRKLA